MFQGIRISLANKCQLLFGAAVVLILIAALAVVWARMKTLVEQAPVNHARLIADAWIAQQATTFNGRPSAPGGEAALGSANGRSGEQESGRTGEPRTQGAHIQALPPGLNGLAKLNPDENLTLTLIPHSAFSGLAAKSAFVKQAIHYFNADADHNEWSQRVIDSAGTPLYRYARAIRQSVLAVRQGAAGGGGRAGADASGGTGGVGDPVEQILLIHLRDPEGASQEMLNRIYIVAAGLAAGLLAIGAFWFITTRIILSPVRLLRDYAQRASEGNLNIRSDINTGDEFEQLSNMFNAMLENLKRNEDQLRSTNKSLDLKLGELAESNVALYEANKMKGEFLANVSHELRTPLNSIVGFTEVLEETFTRDDPTAEKRKRYVRNILTSSRRLLNLITELLDLAKIEAGRMEVYPGPVSPADTAEGLLNLMRPQAAHKKIELELKIEPNLPMIETDPGKLQQILFNFLANAVKFTPPGGTVTLMVSLLPAAGEDQPAKVRFSVSDTGPGIADEDQQRIFDKFTQLQSSETREQGGTGLGLTISQELAQMLRGRIELDSEQGRGATFSLILPIVYKQQSTPLMPADQNAG